MFDPALWLDAHRFLNEPSARIAPYALFARLRAEAPIFPTASGAWLLSRYHAVRHVLTSDAFGVDLWADGDGGPFGSMPRDDHRYSMMSFRDPPVHTCLRSLVSKWFAASDAERHRPVITAVIEKMIGHLGHHDVVADLAHDLPVNVNCAVLGIPASEVDEVRHWTECLSRHLAHMVSGHDERLQEEQRTFARYVARIADRLRDMDGPLGLLHRAHRSGSLTLQELVAYVMLLLVSGRETVTNLVGSAVASLLDHDHQRELLRAKPALLSAAIDETLRYESPVRLVARIAKCHTSIDGVTLPKGATVLALLGSANRDEAIFVEPERFDVLRDARRHLGLGAGAHHCLGGGLGRIEAEEAVRMLVLDPDRRVALAEPGPIAWSDSLLFRGPRTLPVTLERGAGQCSS